MYFYQLNTGAIWASENAVLVNKNGTYTGKFFKVKSIGANPDMETIYDVAFPKKSLACVWSKFELEQEEGQFDALYAKLQKVELEEAEGQLFAKKNPNLHPKDKKKKNGKV